MSDSEELPDERPIHKAPTVTKAPPAGRKFPCPQCGARLDFNPAVQGLNCPYCGYHQEVTSDQEKEVLERCYMEYLSRQESHTRAIAGHSFQTKCTGCGAVVLLEDKVVTEQCPFCHTHLEAKSERVEGMIEPESLLPFQIDLRGARRAFDGWIAGLWFAPSELKKVAALGQLTGVYLPFWTYDSMTDTVYTGQRGDNYTVWESYTERTADGRSVTRTRPVTKIRWRYVSGEVQHFFDDVLICASHSLKLSLINDLGKWELQKLVPFESDYLSGFKTERYTVDLTEGLTEAKKVMEGHIDWLIRQDIGGDHQRVSSARTRYTAITFKHTLLPIWVAVYRYHEKTYQVVVNGASGRVTGYRPYSFWKIFGAVLLATILVAAITGIVMLFNR